MALERLILSTRPGTCTDCGQQFPMNTIVMLNTHKKTARHKKCPEKNCNGAEQAVLFENWVNALEQAGKNE